MMLAIHGRSQLFRIEKRSTYQFAIRALHCCHVLSSIRRTLTCPNTDAGPTRQRANILARPHFQVLFPKPLVQPGPALEDVEQSQMLQKSP